MIPPGKNPYTNAATSGGLTSGALSRICEPYETVYKAGEPASSLFFIQKGMVTADIKTRTIHINKGGVFGDAVLTMDTYKATVIAGPDGCELLEMPMALLQKELNKTPPLIRLLITNMMSRLEIAAHLLQQEDS